MIDRLNTALEGRYRIERELGAGGMATVFLARDIKHNRRVAIKVVKPELAAVVGAERFLAEIETTANLQHPHILPFFDSGEAAVAQMANATPHANYDVSPDGQRFVMVRFNPSSRIMLIQNLPEYVRRQGGGGR